MARLALVLAIAGGLVLFALQNLAPISLVVLGVPSQPLPLAIWLLGAIDAGALTTLVISGLFSASTAFAPRARRAPKRSSNREPNQGASNTPRSSWNPTPNPAKPSSGSTQSVMGDDWEPRPPLEEWEDWDGYQEPAQTSSREPDGYASDRYTSRESRYQPEKVASTGREQEVWDDWDDEASEFRDDGDYPNRKEYLDDESYIPRRTDFEVPQAPVSRRQSGSIYSYSYRNDNDAEDSGVGKSEDVYDAEFRVITPPYYAEPEPELDPREDELDAGNSEDWIEDVQDETAFVNEDKRGVEEERRGIDEERRGDRRSDSSKDDIEDW